MKITIALLVALGASAQAAIIIEDTFNRKGALAGSMADTGQTWDMWTGFNPLVAATGSTLHLEGANSSRIGGLTIAPNMVYNLSVEIGLDDATPQWTGFGFGNQHIDSVGFTLFRFSPEAQFFRENLSGQQTLPLADLSSRLFEIELTTGNTLASSTLNWSIDGSNVGTPTAVDATGLNSVFLQASGSVSTVDNFRLTESIPEPSSALLLGLGSVALLGRRKRN